MRNNPDVIDTELRSEFPTGTAVAELPSKLYSIA